VHHGLEILSKIKHSSKSSSSARLVAMPVNRTRDLQPLLLLGEVVVVYIAVTYRYNKKHKKPSRMESVVIPDNYGGQWARSR
jgi:hypothetical protein